MLPATITGLVVFCIVYAAIFLYGSVPWAREVTRKGHGTRWIFAKAVLLIAWFPVRLFSVACAGMGLGVVLWFPARWLLRKPENWTTMMPGQLRPDPTPFSIGEMGFLGLLFGLVAGVFAWLFDIWYAVKPASSLPSEKPVWTWLPKYAFLVEISPSVFESEDGVSLLTKHLRANGFRQIVAGETKLSFTGSVKGGLIYQNAHPVSGQMELPLGPRTKVTVQYDVQLFDQGKLWMFAHKVKKLFSENDSCFQSAQRTVDSAPTVDEVVLRSSTKETA